jgi:hypothetical protein
VVGQEVEALRLRKLGATKLVIAAMFLIASTAQGVAAPANTLTELWRELNSCIRPPSIGAGSELTIVFALKRDGSLFGLPRITHSHLLGDADAQRAFVAAAIGAVAKCLPVEITDSLGGAIAGRPLSIRIGKRPTNAMFPGFDSPTARPIIAPAATQPPKPVAVRGAR